MDGWTFLLCFMLFLLCQHPLLACYVSWYNLHANANQMLHRALDIWLKVRVIVEDVLKVRESVATAVWLHVQSVPSRLASKCQGHPGFDLMFGNVWGSSRVRCDKGVMTCKKVTKMSLSMTTMSSYSWWCSQGRTFQDYLSHISQCGPRNLGGLVVLLYAQIIRCFWTLDIFRSNCASQSSSGEGRRTHSWSWGNWEDNTSV